MGVLIGKKGITYFERRGYPIRKTFETGDFSVERTELEVAEPQDFPNDMIFEQDPIQIVNSILPLYVNGQVLRTLQESVASELAARMQSMQSASDNAGELAK